MEIHYNKVKIKLFLALGILFATVLIGSIVFFNDILNYSWLMISIIVFLVLVILIVMRFFLVAILRKEPALLFTEKQLTVYPILGNSLTISKEMVKSIAVKERNNRDTLLIILKNPDSFLNDQTGITKWMMQSSLSQYKASIVFAINNLKMGKNDLTTALNVWKS